MTRYTVTFVERPGAKKRYRHVMKTMGAEMVVIKEEEVEPPVEKPKKDNTPTKPVSLAVAALFSRSAETEWTDVEMTAYANAHKTKTLTIENMKTVAAHYERERRKQDNHCRTSILTFLRYWTSELDKARASTPQGSKRGEWPDSNKVVPMPADPAEDERLRAEAKARLAEFRAQQTEKTA